MPGDRGNPRVIDRNRRACLFELEPHNPIRMRDSAVDHHHFNADEVGVEPVGVSSKVPRLSDAVFKLAEDDHWNHDAGRRSQHGLDRPVCHRSLLAVPTGSYKRENGRMTSTAPAAVHAVRDPTVTRWEFLHGDRWIMLGKVPRGRRDVVVVLNRTPKYQVTLPQIVEWRRLGRASTTNARHRG